ncbi:snRNA-activating protein complex subunit 1 [Topomyia yanbarensis]|uniref:snRNA-activating protein complex subunit 1 n=1 Tax=Topomyia yanbarensis TaxID=2498891 RepID=UPI00273B83E2|nr:snRNA-activating protein complex subunit 1 [Topomyia yanbarensis]
MVSEISRGFREDCFSFLNDFSKHESMEFRYFCHEWKRVNFQFVFHGRNTDVELVEFINEALLIVKQIFLCSKKPLEKIGSFYLMYALYFKQPTNQFCKIRVTPADWRSFKRFVRNPTAEQDSQEITVIFWKLLVGDAFRFVQDEKEHGYDPFFVKGLQSNRFDDKVRESFKIIKDAESDFGVMKSNTGLFTALDALEMAYNEMKESLDETASSSADKIPQSNLMQNLHVDLDEVIKILGTDEGTVTSAVAGQEQGNELDSARSNESIGAKRSSIRERAFRRKVNRRDLQIATAISSNVSGDSTTPSSSKAMRPRATKKRDANTSVLIEDHIADMMSTDED